MEGREIEIGMMPHEAQIESIYTNIGWHGMVWHGMVWYGMVWDGMVW